MSGRPLTAWFARAVAPALALLLLAAGCGIGAGPRPGAVRVTVTRDFGASHVLREGPLKVRGEETVMSLLIRNYPVTTRYGGGFVQSIDHLAGGHEHGAPIDWFYYANGVQAPVGAAATKVHRGDRIWWDLHDWSQTEDVPAVVGSFPAPFIAGLAGKRLPVRIECAAVQSTACRVVKARMRKLGVPAAVAGLGGGAGPQTLRVLVGSWGRIAREPVVAAIARGPRASGVYVRIATGGAAFVPLDQEGHPLAPLGAGTGLIAATREQEEAPVWVVTGTDTAGVELAARSLDEATLHDRFAVALRPGAVLSLPGARR